MASSSSVQTMKLSKKEGFEKPNGPVALIIMDGVGQAPDAEWNAVTTSRTPFLDKLMAGEGPNGSKSLFCELDASGKSVGLPSMGDMGNSEVGHNALGAGRVFDQGAKLVNNAFRSGEFKSEVWQWLVEKCVGSDTNTLHLMTE
ncbi:Phosphoglycerate mutase [Gracilaria domingensis]|nr:Phosphoglycerate mutase [Gracilaria domingensis]